MANVPGPVSAGGFLVPPVRNPQLHAMQKNGAAAAPMGATRAYERVTMPPEWRAVLERDLGSCEMTDRFTSVFKLDGAWTLQVLSGQEVLGMDFDMAAEQAAKILRNMLKRHMTPSLELIGLLNRDRRTELFGGTEHLIAEELLLPREHSWMATWFKAQVSGDYTDVHNDPRKRTTLLQATFDHPGLTALHQASHQRQFGSPRELLHHIACERAAGKFTAPPFPPPQAVSDDFHRRMSEEYNQLRAQIAASPLSPPVPAPGPSGRSLYDFFRGKT